MHKLTQISFSIAMLIFHTPSYPQQLPEKISINQQGYYPGAEKIAVVIGDINTDTFYITSTNLRDTIYTGKLSGPHPSSNSGLITRIADFTPVKATGSFVVTIPGAGSSYVFRIGSNVHREVAVAGLKGFYFQRASMPLQFTYAGKWHRSAGHPDTLVLIHPSAASATRKEGSVISTPGGWYDAGDYNKYVVNSGITMGTLLSAYEDFPKYFDKLKTNIPEGNDAVPDILNEALYNLRWMLTMQDPQDGGVYNKCTNAAFDGMVMPGVTQAPRYVVQKGTAATLDFAAVAAQGARIFKSYGSAFPGLSDSCITAAIKAWQWALRNPSLSYDQNEINKKYKPAITTGGYGDRNFSDEWLWAATELFINTHDKKYYDAAEKLISDTLKLPSWSDVAMLANYSLLRFRHALPAYTKAVVERIKAGLISLSDSYISSAATNALQTVMGQSKKDFVWGSNAVAANQGIVLINAYLTTGDKKYIRYALSNLDYLMGRNATGYCFVTGFGSKSPMHPHHRPSVSDGVTEPVPGLLAGGPNPGQQDGCKYDFSEPETSYQDIDCAYASNEIAINWNAPFVYLSNAIEALIR